MPLEQEPLSSLEPVATPNGKNSYRRRNSDNKEVPCETRAWVNLTHPSQLRDKSTRWQVKSFTTTYNNLKNKSSKGKRKAAGEQKRQHLDESHIEPDIDIPNSSPMSLHSILNGTCSTGWPLYKDSSIGRLRIECIESYPAKESPRLSRALDYCTSRAR
jgi:hypothetical protein